MIFGSRARVVVCATLLTLCAAYTAYHRVFVSLANYDDEGFMMWTVKNFLGGRALYDPEAFRKAGIELVFLPDYDGPYTMMLPALLAEDPATIAADILSVPAA